MHIMTEGKIKESLVSADHTGYQEARNLERFLSHEQYKPFSELKNALAYAQAKTRPGNFMEHLLGQLKAQQELVEMFETHHMVKRADKEKNEMREIEQQIREHEQAINAPLKKVITAEIESALALARNKVGSKYSTSFLRYVEMLVAEVKKNGVAIPKMNTQELCSLATTFLEIHEREQKEFEIFREEVQTAFINDIHTAIARGDLPESSSANLAALPNVLWRLIPVTDYGEEVTQVKHTTLAQRHRSGIIKIATPVFVYDKALAKEAAYHEMLHEIAGAARHYIPHAHDDDFRDSKSGLSTHRSFTWIDEATTEYLTHELLGTGQETSEVYITERGRLQKLFDNDLEKMLVWEAYFEDITRDQEKEGRGEKYKALVQAINNIEGAGGFNKIEHEFILSNAVYDAQKFLQATGFTQARKSEAIAFPDTETDDADTIVQSIV
jgi:hypothetical protein